MKDNEILVMTSSGPVPFDKADIPEGVKGILSKILKDLFPEGNEDLKRCKPAVSPEMTIEYYEQKIADRNNLPYGTIDDILELLWDIQPGCVLSILLRAVAMEMDLNYPDHISQAEDIWVVNIADGQIVKIKNPGKGYRNFAAFRCLDDAKGACLVLKPLFKKIYGGKQEN